MNDFSKLYLLSPESYNKLIFDKMAHQGIDREMYNILNMKKITDSKKWYMYRDELVKFASKARNNKILNNKALNIIGTNIADFARENNMQKKKPLTYSVQSQTNIERRPRKDQNIQPEKALRETGVQTDHIIDETYYDGNTSDAYYNEEDLSGNRSWPYSEAMPGFAAFNISNSKSPSGGSKGVVRKSLSYGTLPVGSSTPLTSKDVAKQLLSKAKRPPLRKTHSTETGKPDAQRQLNFQIIKSPYKTRANVKAAAAVQSGKSRFKWACMK